MSKGSSYQGIMHSSGLLQMGHWCPAARTAPKPYLAASKQAWHAPCCLTELHLVMRKTSSLNEFLFQKQQALACTLLHVRETEDWRPCWDPPPTTAGSCLSPLQLGWLYLSWARTPDTGPEPVPCGRFKRGRCCFLGALEGGGCQKRAHPSAPHC